MDNLGDLAALVPDVDVVGGDVIASVNGARTIIGTMGATLTLNEIGEKLVDDTRAKLDAEAVAEAAGDLMRPRRGGRRPVPASKGTDLTLSVADTQNTTDQVAG